MATAVMSSEVGPVRWPWLPTELPSLEGSRGRVVGVVFIAVTTLAFLLGIGATVFDGLDLFRNIPVDVGYGFRTVTLEHDGNTVYNVSEAARKAGLRKDDRILAIDGDRIGAGASENDIGARMARAGRAVTLVVQGADAPPHRVVLHHVRGSIWTAANVRDGMPVWLSAAINFLSEVGVSWILLAAAWLLFLRRRHDRGAMAFALAFALTAINGPAAFWLLAYTPAWLAYYLPDALGNSGLVLFVVAVAAFPDGRFRNVVTRTAPFLALPLLVTMWGLVVLHPSIYAPPPWTLAIRNYAFPIADVGLLLCVGAQILRYRREPLTSVERQQFKWVLLGFAIAVMAIAVVQLIIQTGSASSTDPLLNGTFGIGLLIFALAPPLGLLVSLLRYRLYDAESVIGRSAAYGVLTLGFIALFAGAEKLAEIIGERFFEHSIGIIAGAVGAAVAAAVVVPLHNRVHRWAERRFQKPLIRLREGLPECVADLRDTASVEQIAEAVMKRVAAGVRSTREAVLLAHGPTMAIAGTNDVSVKAVEEWQKNWQPQPGEEPLDCDRKDVLFAMRVRLCIETADKPVTIGWLLLGPRPDGSFFGKDEREALAHVAGPIARAIHIAQLREAREERAESRLCTLETLIEKLAAAVGRGSAATA